MTRRVSTFALAAFTMACSAGNSMFVPSEQLSPALRATLDSLVLDERRAHARYEQVLEQFGRVAPFQSMVGTQNDRVAALLQIYRKYPAFPPSESALVGDREPFGSLAGACLVAAQHEQATVDRYSRALALRPPSGVDKVLKRNRALTLSGEVAAAKRCM